MTRRDLFKMLLATSAAAVAVPQVTHRTDPIDVQSLLSQADLCPIADEMRRRIVVPQVSDSHLEPGWFVTADYDNHCRMAQPGDVIVGVAKSAALPGEPVWVELVQDIAVSVVNYG